MANSLCFVFFFFVSTALLSHSVPVFVAGFHYRRLNSVLNDTRNASSYNSTQHHRHKWVGPTGHRVVTVDINGSGDYKSVQAAVNAVPENNTLNVTIRISPGYYVYKYIIYTTLHAFFDALLINYTKY